MIAITDVRRHYRFSPENVELVLIHDAAGLVCRLACFEPRQLLAALPFETSAMCYVLEGTGLFHSGEKLDHLSAGGWVSTDRGATLSIENPGPGRLVVAIASLG